MAVLLLLSSYNVWPPMNSRRIEVGGMAAIFIQFLKQVVLGVALTFS